MSKIIGITGGIGSGKTTLVNYIASKGYPVYIADDAGKKVMEFPHIVRKINELFNNEVLLDNGLLDRKKISSIVFKDKELLQKLNDIVHPEVALHFETFKKQHVNDLLIFKEAAILFESGSYKNCDATILITAPITVRIERVMKRDHVVKEVVLDRMKNQMSDEDKIKLATYVVENVVLNDAMKKIDQILIDILNN